MEISEYKNIYDNEKEHFFYVSTHRLIVGLIKKWFGNKRNLKILDAGCGTGGLMDQLSCFGKVTGIDFIPEAIRFSKARGHKAIRASVEKIPFPDKYFDLVTSIDVIYHRAVKDDVLALSEFRRILKPNGFLILRVPANKFLMSAHDRHVHTARRYSKTELKEKMEMAGLMSKQVSFVHSPIFLLSLINVFLENVSGKKNDSAVTKISSLVNRLIICILNIEVKMIERGISILFGQGLIVVGQKLSNKASLNKENS